MKIDKRTTFAEIQTAFQQQFPHLRLEFYRKPHVQGQGSADREKLDHNQTLGNVDSAMGVHELHFNGSQQITELESMFEERFGLHVQVFRRSGSIWLQTTQTDTWTLHEANRKGGHSNEIVRENE